MASITESLRLSFDNFNRQIAAAVKLLKKLPGSRTEDAVVAVDDIVDDPNAVMRFGCPVHRDDIVVYEFDEYRLLDDHALDIQVKLVYKIPELIQIARSSELVIQAQLDAAADAIEHAIAIAGTHESESTCETPIQMDYELRAKAKSILFSMLALLDSGKTVVTNRDIAVAGDPNCQKDLTATMGAHDEVVRMKWEGRTGADGYFATTDRSNGRSLVGLGLVEPAGKVGREVQWSLTKQGFEVAEHLKANLS
jgi:hypothetical protein